MAYQIRIQSLSKFELKRAIIDYLADGLAEGAGSVSVHDIVIVPYTLDVVTLARVLAEIAGDRNLEAKGAPL